MIKLSSVLKKLIVPVKNIHSHNTRHQILVYEIKHRRPIGRRLLKCNASNEWNKLPKNVILQETHGAFKNEFYKSKLSSYKESTFNFAPNMFYSIPPAHSDLPQCTVHAACVSL